MNRYQLDINIIIDAETSVEAEAAVEEALGTLGEVDCDFLSSECLEWGIDE